MCLFFIAGKKICQHGKKIWLWDIHFMYLYIVHRFKHNRISIHNFDRERRLRIDGADFCNRRFCCLLQRQKQNCQVSPVYFSMPYHPWFVNRTSIDHLDVLLGVSRSHECSRWLGWYSGSFGASWTVTYWHSDRYWIIAIKFSEWFLYHVYMS